MFICYVLWLFGIFYGYLVYFMFIWLYFSDIGMLHQKKSGNPCLGHAALNGAALSPTEPKFTPEKLSWRAPSRGTEG
jgi:hypothetical protein